MGGNRDGAPRQSTDRLDTLQREQHQDITDKAGAQQQDKVCRTYGIISYKGYGPDKEKDAAIAQFPEPKNLRDLRGFIGLANQLGMFIPDLAHMTSPLGPLMKRDIARVWLQENEDAFLKTKVLLTSTSMVKPFDQTKETLMLTDTSRLYGLGFAKFRKPYMARAPL